MKKLFKPHSLISLIIAFVLCFAWSANAYAQGGLVYNSGIQIVNNGTDVANIILTFYNPDGTYLSFPDTIALGSANTYFGATMPSGLPADFKGSLVVSSDQPLSAIANLTGAGGGTSYNASTTSFSSGELEFNLPLIMCNNNGYNTFFNVQNTGSSDAHITVYYVPGPKYGSASSETATIPSGAAMTFDQATGSTTKNCSNIGTTRGAVLSFIGSVKIISDVPVVATVMELNTSVVKAMMGYNGFAKGATKISAPLIMANNGINTSIQVMNVGTLTTTVTIDYSSYTNPYNGAIVHPADDTCVLGPGKACGKLNNPASDPKWPSGSKADRYVGGATLTTDNGQKIVAIVNQNYPTFASSYEGIDVNDATANVSLPFITSNVGGSLSTSLSVQNVGTGDCSTITIHYAANTAPGQTWQVPNDVVISNLSSGSTKAVLQSGTDLAGNVWPTAGGPVRYKGSAEVSAPGCQIAVIVNENGAMAGGDNFLTYNGFNH